VGDHVTGEADDLGVQPVIAGESIIINDVRTDESAEHIRWIGIVVDSGMRRTPFVNGAAIIDGITLFVRDIVQEEVDGEVDHRGVSDCWVWSDPGQQQPFSIEHGRPAVELGVSSGVRSQNRGRENDGGVDEQEARAA